MAGGFFLLQRVDINHVGLKITGTEYIGYDESNDTLKSYIFGNTGPSPFGGALEYVWEVDEDILTIWGVHKGSPAAFKGEFGVTRNTGAGHWGWLGGGDGETSTRVEQAVRSSLYQPERRQNEQG